MKNRVLVARAFFCIDVTGMSLQQFYYGEFRPAFILQWFSWLPFMTLFADIAGGLLIFLSVCILLNKNPKDAALLLAVIFLFFFIAFQVPFMLFVYTNPAEWGAWTNPLKTLALCGGALIVAGTFPITTSITRVQRILSPLIPFGKVLFSVMLIVFGIDHFLYTGFVATLVPAWIPSPVFWTYFAAVALVGAGTAILLNIKRRLIATLTGIMLLLWFLILHIPRAIQYSEVQKGNELTSVFKALAFSGVAFLIAFSTQTNNKLLLAKRRQAAEPMLKLIK